MTPKAVSLLPNLTAFLGPLYRPMTTHREVPDEARSTSFYFECGTRTVAILDVWLPLASVAVYVIV